MKSKVLAYQSISSQVSWSTISVKRVFDVLFSLGVLVVFAPIFLAIVLVIGKKAFYVQRRLGRGGTFFKCYKFRTMHSDADELLPQLLQHNPDLRHEWEIHQKLHDDPRVFPMGRWLRKTSLDELPQFWNVIKGDLSVVGPRPYMAEQKPQMGPLAHTILSVRPGITGLWQTSGRSRTSFAERIALDAEYINKRTFWFDLWLILKTIPQVFFPTDAC